MATNKIDKIKIKNFTVFENTEIEFCDSINVFIGENGTGKTHLLKILYAWCECDSVVPHTDPSSFASKVAQCFQTTLLDRHDTDIFNIRVTGSNMPSGVIPATFIPAKEMLTHSRGLRVMMKKFSNDMPFDITLLDIIERTEQWKVNNIPEMVTSIIKTLERIIGGTIIQENGDFYVLNYKGVKVPFSCEAEGIKKFGLLWQLLMAEIITKETILIWDEPEANINPKLIPDLVEIILELSRQGVQIFLSTHDYIFAKYLEVKMNEDDNVLFHALYKDGDGVEVETRNEFSTLENNSIIQESVYLYKEELKKVMK